ncbi:MAG: MlaD family protein [Wenzhouxiangellaceae bacterium]|nr:MlaD family protein [Wenzhouxiangellaceae bacterium]
METRASYVIIGAFTFIVAIAAVLFGLFATRFALDQAWNEYEVLFTESVIGLSRGSPVLYNGVNVGRVLELKLNPEDVREVLARVEIDASVPIYRDAVATLRLTGLTGTAAVQLRGGTPSSGLLQPEGRGLARIQSQESPLARLLESSEGIVVTANRVVERLDRMFSGDNVERVSGALEATERLTAQLADPEGPLNRLLTAGAETGESLPELLAELRRAGATFEGFIAGLDRELVEPLPELRDQLNQTLANMASITGRIDAIVGRNQQSLMNMGNRGLRNVNAGVEELRSLLRDLSQLVRRIEANPSQFLFGGEQLEEYPQ